MNLARFSNRLATVGVAGTLAAAGLVGASTTAADAAAATGTSAYNCTAFAGTPLETVIPLVMSVTADLPASSWTTHAPVPGGLPITEIDVTVPEAVVAGLGGFGIDQVGIGDNSFGLRIGTAKIPLTGLAAARQAPPATGDMTISVTGVMTEAFTMATNAGNYQISMPSTFVVDVLTHTASGDASIDDVACAIADPTTAAITPFRVDKQTATMTAKAPKRVKRGHVVPVTVNVKGQYMPATGSVSGKEKGKKAVVATLRKGVAVLKFRGLKVGKHTFTVSYKGDKNTLATPSKTVTVKVTR